MDQDKKLNDLVARWRRKVTAKLKASIANAGIEHKDIVRKKPTSEPVVNRAASKDVLKSAQRQKFGIVSSVGFKFPRHMVFVEKGVSRGHPISNPRKAKPWFNKVIETEIEELADIVAENAADRIISDSFDRMKIR